MDKRLELIKEKLADCEAALASKEDELTAANEEIERQKEIVLSKTKAYTKLHKEKEELETAGQALADHIGNSPLPLNQNCTNKIYHIMSEWRQALNTEVKNSEPDPA